MTIVQHVAIFEEGADGVGVVEGEPVALPIIPTPWGGPLMTSRP